MKFALFEVGTYRIYLCILYLSLLQNPEPLPSPARLELNSCLGVFLILTLVVGEVFKVPRRLGLLITLIILIYGREHTSRRRSAP